MGKRNGFVVWKRQGAPRRPVGERTHDWREIYEERTAEAKTQQSARCMDCGVPFCHQGCPLGNLIPDFNDLVFRGEWDDAFKSLSSTNNFPEFTGRLCPAPCEAACVLGINDSAVTIEQIEKEIAEAAWAKGIVKPQIPRQRTGKTVAVVGSGPAGLAAAQQLARAGHAVTLFERDDRIGGLLRYGIPDFKMEKWVIDRRMAQMEAEGVIFRTGVHVGTDITWDALKAQHDAVVICIGAQRPRDLPVPGRELGGVVFAMQFLEGQNRVVAGDLSDAPISAAGKHVIILGGGDTGSDCLGTSHRHGAASVRQIELMPVSAQARAANNPWPQWPLVFTTSSSQEEGGERAYAMRTTRLEGEDGQIKRLYAEQITFEDGKMVAVPDSEEAFECDLLVLAMGFLGPIVETLSAQLGVEINARGNVATKQFRTALPGVYAAGDAQRGQSLIVWAISDGREAARVVDADLVGAERLVTRGRNLHFGGR